MYVCRLVIAIDVMYYIVMWLYFHWKILLLHLLLSFDVDPVEFLQIHKRSYGPNLDFYFVFFQELGYGRNVRIV